MASPSERFGTFFNNWLNCQETLLQQLLTSIAPENLENTEQHRNLTAQVLSHYKLYFEEKISAAREDVFVFINPPWLTSFERTLLWLGEFKPSVLFRLLYNSVKDLTPEQSARIEQVKVCTRREEKDLTEKMAIIQESLAAPPNLNLSRRFGRLIDGEVCEMEAAVEMLKSAMLSVLESADVLRGSTALNVLEVLTSVQAVNFLAAAIEFQLQMRRLGQRRNTQTSAANNSVP